MDSQITNKINCESKGWIYYAITCAFVCVITFSPVGKWLFVNHDSVIVGESDFELLQDFHTAIWNNINGMSDTIADYLEERKDSGMRRYWHCDVSTAFSIDFSDHVDFADGVYDSNEYSKAYSHYQKHGYGDDEVKQLIVPIRQKDKRVYVRWADYDLEYGVFSQINLPKDHVLGFYTGILTFNVSYFEHAWKFPGFDLYIDATNTGNILRFINHHNIPNVDVKYVSHDDIIYAVFITSRKISKGEQLFVQYTNQEHWKHHVKYLPLPIGAKDYSSDEQPLYYDE